MVREGGLIGFGLVCLSRRKKNHHMSKLSDRSLLLADHGVRGTPARRQAAAAPSPRCDTDAQVRGGWSQNLIG